MIGYIHKYGGEYLYIVAKYPFSGELARKEITQCEIRLDDGRHISADQRKKIYATMRDISLYTGHTPDEVKALMKYDFISKSGHDYFSLSDTDMTTANQFLNFLIDFCVEFDAPCADSLLERSPDIARYLYKCLIEKKCCITGKKAELHHVDAVGRGRNRKDIIHKGMRVLPLCREMHTLAHNMGRDSFCEKYHIFGIKLDTYLCGIWKVRAE